MDRSFERTEDGVEARPLAGEDALEIAADRLDEDEHETEKQGVLQQAEAVHVRPFRRPSARLVSLVRTGPSVAWEVCRLLSMAGECSGRAGPAFRLSQAVEHLPKDDRAPRQGVA